MQPVRQEAPLRPKAGDWACIFVEMGGSYREPIEKAEVHNEFILSHYIQEKPGIDTEGRALAPIWVFIRVGDGAAQRDLLV